MYFDLERIRTKAEESIKAARLCLDNRHYNVAASRSYYATLQFATYALAKRKIQFNETHRSVLEKFRQQFVATLPKLPADLNFLFGLRLKADYQEQNISPNSAADAYARAADFLNQLKQQTPNTP